MLRWLSETEHLRDETVFYSPLSGLWSALRSPWRIVKGTGGPPGPLLWAALPSTPDGMRVPLSELLLRVLIIPGVFV